MKNVTFVSNNAMYFYTHRLQLGLCALDLGFSVKLFVGRDASDPNEKWAENNILRSGIEVRRVKYSSVSVNLFEELLGLVQLYFALRKTRPDIIHSMSPKGNLYAGIASFGLSTTNIFSISGVGYLFLKKKQDSLYNKFLRIVYATLFRAVLRLKDKKIIVVQNNHDLGSIVGRMKLDRGDVRLIRGLGVPIKKERDLETKLRTVLFPARMLKNKGANEFAIAAMRLKSRYPDWEFIMAGRIDLENPDTVQSDQIDYWRSNGLEVLDFVKDMEPLYNAASIVCLPSYGEGFPKCLVEASEASAAIVTSDVVGCRDVVASFDRGVSKNKVQGGLLVKSADANALEKELEKLITNQKLRIKLANAARKNAVKNFDVSLITAAFRNMYEHCG